MPTALLTAHYLAAHLLYAVIAFIVACGSATAIMGSSQSTPNSAPKASDGEAQGVTDMANGIRCTLPVGNAIVITPVMMSKGNQTDTESQSMDVLKARLEQFSREVHQLIHQQSQSRDVIRDLGQRLGSEVQQLRHAVHQDRQESENEDHRVPDIFGLSGGRKRRR